jgi:hypothetical protein
MNHKRAPGVVLEAGGFAHGARTTGIGTTAGADDRRPSAARALTGLLAVLLVVAGLLALRHGMHHPAATAEAGTVTSSGPQIAALPVYDNARRYDSLPGRTQLSLPEVNGDQVTGDLPHLPGPSRTAAVRAAALVLQRYCANPEQVRTRLVDVASATGRDGSGRRGGGWWSVTAQTRSPASSPITVSLLWTDPSYSWTGSLRQLVGCA